VPARGIPNQEGLFLSDAFGKLLYALLFRRRIESGTSNRWLDRLFFGRWFGPRTSGAASYSERQQVRVAAHDYDGRVRKARNRFEKLERTLGPSDPRTLAAKLELDAALADKGNLDASWAEWDAKRHQPLG
jgi:hypothetical protein